MTKRRQPLPEPSADARRALRAEYDHLLSIEGNPLTSAEKELFDGFDKAGLTTDERLARIKDMFAKPEDPATNAGDGDVE